MPWWTFILRTIQVVCAIPQPNRLLYILSMRIQNTLGCFKLDPRGWIFLYKKWRSHRVGMMSEAVLRSSWKLWRKMLSPTPWHQKRSFLLWINRHNFFFFFPTIYFPTVVHILLPCAPGMQKEIRSLKEQLQCMLKDNNILKKGIQIQHERNLEQEEKLKEAPHLKHFISQCQEQIRKLEVR